MAIAHHDQLRPASSVLQVQRSVFFSAPLRPPQSCVALVSRSDLRLLFDSVQLVWYNQSHRHHQPRNGITNSLSHITTSWVTSCVECVSFWRLARAGANHFSGKYRRVRKWQEYHLYLPRRFDTNFWLLLKEVIDGSGDQGGPNTQSRRV